MALNPVRARLVQRPQDWAWSSLRAHLDGCDDGLVAVAPLLDRLGSVTALIDTEPEAEALARLRAAQTIGRPLGSDEFVTRLEGIVQRRLRRNRPLAPISRVAKPCFNRNLLSVVLSPGTGSATTRFREGNCWFSGCVAAGCACATV